MKTEESEKKKDKTCEEREGRAKKEKRFMKLGERE